MFALRVPTTRSHGVEHEGVCLPSVADAHFGSREQDSETRRAAAPADSQIKFLAAQQLGDGKVVLPGLSAQQSAKGPYPVGIDVHYTIQLAVCGCHRNIIWQREEGNRRVGIPVAHGLDQWAGEEHIAHKVKSTNQNATDCKWKIRLPATVKKRCPRPHDQVTGAAHCSTREHPQDWTHYRALFDVVRTHHK